MLKMVADYLVHYEVIIVGEKRRIGRAITRELVEMVVCSQNLRITDIGEIDCEDCLIHKGLYSEEFNIPPSLHCFYSVGLFWKLEHTSKLKLVDLVKSVSRRDIALH